jgi:amidase
MGRHVADVAVMFGVLAQQSERRVEATSLVVAKNWRTEHPATDQMFDDVVEDLRRAGFSIVERDLAVPQESERQDEFTVLLAELVDDLSQYLADRPGEGVHSLAEVILYEDEHAEIEQRYFGHELFLAALETGGRQGPAYPESRQRNLAWALETCLEPGIEGSDVIIAPAYGPTWKSDLVVGGHPGPASPIIGPPAIAGWPILSLPMGVVEGLPVGLGIVGRADSEWTILDAAARIEKLLRAASPWPSPLWQRPTRG